MPLRVPLVVLVLVVGVGCGVAARAILSLGEHAGGAGSRTGATAQAAPPQSTHALVVLRAWDEGRSRAWAEGDVAALARLYVRGSTAGHRDCALLRAYLQRGVTVPELRMQILRSAVLVDRPRRVVIRLTERLSSRGARVGTDSVLLPRDRADTRIVELRRVQGTWRVVRVVR